MLSDLKKNSIQKKCLIEKVYSYTFDTHGFNIEGQENCNKSIKVFACCTLI